MQILKEQPNGERVRVTKDQYEYDLMMNSKDLYHFVRQQHVVIYHTNGGAYRSPKQQSVHYGGRGRAAKAGSPEYGFC